MMQLQITTELLITMMKMKKDGWLGYNKINKKKIR